MHAVSQSFILPSAVSALAFTTSKYGVAAKDLVCINGLGQVALLPRRLLDPRRPRGKPSKADADELLVPYAPVLPHVPEALLSHAYPVAGLARLAAAPALLESTSLVLAFGLDLFCTRAVQPSGAFDLLGDGFNKIQLVGTLAALSVGVLVAAPAVARKALRAKWF